MTKDREFDETSYAEMVWLRGPYRLRLRVTSAGTQWKAICWAPGERPAVGPWRDKMGTALQDVAAPTFDETWTTQAEVDTFFAMLKVLT